MKTDAIEKPSILTVFAADALKSPATVTGGARRRRRNRRRNKRGNGGRSRNGRSNNGNSRTNNSRSNT